MKVGIDRLLVVCSQKKELVFTVSKGEIFVSGRIDRFHIQDMAKESNLEALTLLFEQKLSERSGFLNLIV